MNKIVEQQLKSCRVARINLEQLEETGNIQIPKYQEPKYELYKCYLVKIPPDIVNNKKSNLAINWNNSTSPSHNCLKIYVIRMLGTMIYVDSLAYDLENKLDLNFLWSGWLDTKYIVQLNCL